MEDDYDEYRRWDGDVDVEVCFITLIKLPTYIILIKSIKYNVLHKILIVASRLKIKINC